MEKVRVAVIGFGHLGKWHTQKADVLPNCELVAVIERKEKIWEEISRQYPQCIITDKLEDIIGKIDAAIIATPTSTHFQFVKGLLAHKKHVFCEKTITQTLQEVLSIKEEIPPGVKLQIGHSERFHNCWVPLIQNNFHDKLTHDSFMKIERRALFKGRATDVDVVQDLMIHDIDLLLWIMNEIPTSVKCHGSKILTKYWDNVTAVFDFASGRQAIITSCRGYTSEIRQLDLSNNNGYLNIDLLNLKVSHSTFNKETSLVDIEEYQYEKNDHLLSEQESFYNSILNDEATIISVDDGIHAANLIEKVLISLQTNKAIQIESL
jgi:predicted dehydrogenase